MKKTFIIDTNVLIHDPESLLKFEDNDIVIPLVVIEELDSLKRGSGEINYAAREALRVIERLCDGGDISQGARLNDTGAMLRIDIRDGNILHEDTKDNRIITVASRIKQTDNNVVLVSKDTAMRLKANALGIKTEDYRHDKTTVYEQYGSVGDMDYHNGIRSVRYLKHGKGLVRVIGNEISGVVKNKAVVGRLIGKNDEQIAAIDALMSDEISVVALSGRAGSGKTLLALACGLHQVYKGGIYKQVLVARPVVPLGGQDIGYLPGDTQEKIAPYMRPIYDNLEVILNQASVGGRSSGEMKHKSVQEMVKAGVLHMEALAYMRGRSLPERYIIIDEAQNLRPLDVKTIITRCGEGTKIVLTGDLEQIDSPFLDRTSNGLAYLISKFINEEFFCYLRLNQSVRSRLAEAGARLL
jgi:PhoH-like ATPase